MEEPCASRKMAEMLGSVGVKGSCRSSQDDLPGQDFDSVEVCCFKLGVLTSLVVMKLNTRGRTHKKGTKPVR